MKVDLRSCVQVGGDRQAAEARVESMRAAMPRSVRYVVGPFGEVKHQDGRMLSSGSPLTGPEELAQVDGRNVALLWRDLLFTCRVVENHAWIPPENVVSSTETHSKKPAKTAGPVA